jgi:hypothetical protein
MAFYMSFTCTSKIRKLVFEMNGVLPDPFISYSSNWLFTENFLPLEKKFFKNWHLNGIK